jgi:pyrroline-5-carboxylate reductase
LPFSGNFELPFGVTQILKAAMTTAIIGTGVMGEALLAGFMRAGMPKSEFIATSRRADRSEEIAQKYGVQVLPNSEAVAKADVVLLMVKPQDMPTVLGEIAPTLSKGALVISFAAGFPIAKIEAALASGTPVIRVMPNTPALVDQGMTAISPGTHCTNEHLETAEKLVNSVGLSVRVPEKYQDAVTAISGSGPAYIFYVVEAMIESGVMLGLPRDVSTELVYQTVMGAATMLKETNTHPTVLREQVTSPGGTTVAALRQFDDFKVRAAFMSAMEAARNRSRELGS